MQQVCMHYGILGATNSSRDVTDLECYHKASRNQHQLRQPAVAKTNFATQFISKSSLTYPLYVLLACKSQMYTLSLTSSMPPIQASSTQSSSTINVTELILYAARSNLVQTKLDNPLLHQIIQCCKNCNPSRKKTQAKLVIAKTCLNLRYCGLLVGNPCTATIGLHVPQLCSQNLQRERSHTRQQLQAGKITCWLRQRKALNLPAGWLLANHVLQIWMQSHFPQMNECTIQDCYLSAISANCEKQLPFL